MVAIVPKGCDNEAGMLDMEPPFEKHVFVDCVFVVQVYVVQMFDEHSFGGYPGEHKFDCQVRFPPSRRTEASSQ